MNPDPDDRSVVQVMGFDRALTAYADWCVAQRCGLGRDRAGVVAAIAGLLRGLDSHPLPAGDRLLTQSLAVTGIVFPLYGSDTSFPMLTRALTEARSGRGLQLLQLADAYNGRSNGHYDPLNSAFYAIRCLDRGDRGIAGAEAEAREDAARAPLLGPWFGADLVCPTWPVAPQPDPGPIRTGQTAPILVVGTTGDSATPYEYAVRMAGALASGVLVTRVGEGHAAYGHGNACIDDAVVAYFHDRVPAAGLRCP